MSQLISFLDQHLIQALGWTFVHTLWQGCVIVLIMIFALQRIPHKDAIKRYTVATASMLSMFVAALATFSLLYFQPGQAETAATAAATGTITVASKTASWSLLGWLTKNLDAMVAIWAIGVAILSLRLMIGMAFIYRLKQTSSDLTYSLGSRAHNIARKLKYGRALLVAESALVKIPVVVGYLKPVILFPVGAVNQLSTDEVEAVLAHEIAHLVRNDFLHNLIQSAIEIIFYYHPAVWWISAVVRAERENCCDDLAIQVCGNSFTYAKALVRLQEVGSSSPALALPFSGSKNHLLQRVKRILNQPQNKSNLMEKITATSLLLLCLILASFNESAGAEKRTTVDVPRLVTHYNSYIDYSPPADTIIPRRSHIVLHEEEDGKSFKVEMENGEIQSLKVDGEEIPADRYAEYQDEIDRMQRNMQSIAPPPPPPAPYLPPMPNMPPAPTAAPMPPMPPMPNMPAPPPAPKVPDMSQFEFDFDFNFDSMEFEFPKNFEFNHDMNVIVEVAPQVHTGHGETNRSESIIIRERNADGSMSYRVEGTGSSIEIDEAAGVAIIDGNEVLIDSDSIIVIEETHTTPGHHFAIAPDVEWNAAEWNEEWSNQWNGQWDSAIWNKEWKANWDADKWAKEWESSWDQEAWDKYWKENGDAWKKYSEEVRQNMKEFKESPEWKEYEKKIEEYREKHKDSNGNSFFFRSDDGNEVEYVVRSREQLDNARVLQDESIRYHVIRGQEVERIQQKEVEREVRKAGEVKNGHSMLFDQNAPHQYVLANKGQMQYTIANGSLTIPDVGECNESEAVTIIAKIADINGEDGKLAMTGDVVLRGNVAINPNRVILVTNESLTIDGQPLSPEALKKHNIEIKVNQAVPGQVKGVSTGKTAKF